MPSKSKSFTKKWKINNPYYTFAVSLKKIGQNVSKITFAIR